MFNNRFTPWVWTELLAFDRNEPDCGAAGYLEELGFVPEGMCLLVSSPDFLLSHPISRTKLITEKLLSVYFRILILNTIVICISLACIMLIGKKQGKMQVKVIY